MKFLLILFSLAIFTKALPQSASKNSKGELIFQSGFEVKSRVIKRGSDADIIGVDTSGPAANDWVANLDDHPDIGNFSLQFQGGDSTMRYARIIPEPGNSNNHVLAFWLDQPNVDQKKGRIQANLYNNAGLKEIYQSVRVYLHEDFNAVKTFQNKIHWLTIAEFWNNITWSQKVPFGFRITLGIGKPSEGYGDLHFIIDAEDCILFEDGRQKYTTVWAEVNREINVPIAKWFTMEYFYKEGGHDDGRFYLAITPEGGTKQVVFDLKKITHNTGDPSPNGLSDFNPMKLYTSKELIAHMKRNGKTLQIWWDDFQLWKNRQP